MRPVFNMDKVTPGADLLNFFCKATPLMVVSTQPPLCAGVNQFEYITFAVPGGPVGPAGPATPAGPGGPAGPAGPSFSQLTTVIKMVKSRNVSGMIFFILIG